MTAVAFFIYKRPELTQMVFEQIRKHAPKKLYIIADGPKVEIENSRCLEARAVTENVDWPCSVFRSYANRNLGCRERISSGLDLVFSREERAMVLEDDCLPSPSFFVFADVMLRRFEQNSDVSMICGSQPLGVWDRGFDYYFSRHSLIWGWASWRRTWKFYDEKLREWPRLKEAGLVSQVVSNPLEAELCERRFQKVYDGHDTWDHQLTIACWLSGGRTIMPAANLVKNIGFGPEATHTTDKSEESVLSVNHMELSPPYSGPASITPDHEMDDTISRLLLKELRKGQVND